LYSGTEFKVPTDGEPPCDMTWWPQHKCWTPLAVAMCHNSMDIFKDITDPETKKIVPTLKVGVVSTLVKAGANVNVATGSRVPLLVLAAILCNWNHPEQKAQELLPEEHRESMIQDIEAWAGNRVGAKMFALLLALGARCDIKYQGRTIQDLVGPDYFNHPALIYYVDRALDTEVVPNLTDRVRIRREASGVSLVRGLHYKVFGHAYAVQEIEDYVCQLYRMWAKEDADSNKRRQGYPGILVLTGAPGSGKTELAKWLSCILSEDADAFFMFKCSDSTSLQEMFGRTRTEFAVNDDGSALMQHFRKYQGKRNVVVIDEIEKVFRSSAEIVTRWLAIFGEGVCANRADDQASPLDVKRTLFVLASNIGDKPLLQMTRQDEVDSKKFSDMGVAASDGWDEFCQGGPGQEDMAVPCEEMLGRLGRGRIIPFGCFSKRDVSCIVDEMQRAVVLECSQEGLPLIHFDGKIFDQIYKTYQRKTKLGYRCFPPLGEALVNSIGKCQETEEFDQILEEYDPANEDTLVPEIFVFYNAAMKKYAAVHDLAQAPNDFAARSLEMGSVTDSNGFRD